MATLANGVKPSATQTNTVRSSIFPALALSLALSLVLALAHDAGTKLARVQYAIPALQSEIQLNPSEVLANHETQSLTREIHALGDYIAERWNIDPKSATRVVRMADGAAKAHNVDLLLVLAVVARESAFQYRGNAFDMRLNALTRTVNPDVAHGLMQVAGRYHPEKMPVDSNGRRRVTTDQENVQIGTQILSEYIALEDGNVARALQRYNGNTTDAERRFSSYVLRVRKDLEKINS